MTDQWERFADSVDRSFGALGWGANVDVYEPSETHTAGEGYDVSYPAEPTATVTGAVQPPSSAADVDRGGTTEQVDLILYVPADTGVTWTGAGESGQANTRLEVAADAATFEVDSVEPQHDGTVRLDCDEVDA